jgi:hypothetical protein
MKEWGKLVHGVVHAIEGLHGVLSLKAKRAPGKPSMG